MSNLFPIKVLFDFEKGQLQSSKNTAGEYTFITASSEWKTHELFTHNCEALIFAMAASGSLGRTHYFNGKFIASDLCFILTPKEKYKDQIDLKFYYTIFNDLREEIVKQTATGTSKISINRENFGNYEIPFFDKDHQEQVRTKLDTVHPIKDGLSAELQTQSDLIAKLRASILSDAVSGRLVPQDPNDEPASILLDKIRAEKERLIKEGKIKREKSLSPIAEDKIPYELPEGWVWVTLLDLFAVIGGATPNKSISAYWNGNIPWVSPKDMKIEYLSDAQDHVTELAFIETRLPVIPENSLLIVVRGMILLHSFPIALTSVPVAINQDMKALSPFLNEVIPYLMVALKGHKKLLLDLVAHSTHGTCKLESHKLFAFKFGLPPLAEQHRIVAKVEQLTITYDALEAEVAKSRTETDRLMQTILKEAFD